MVEHRWRHLRRKAQVHRDGMTLRRADAAPIGRESETLLVVGGDHLQQLDVSDAPSAAVGLGEQLIDVCPPLWIQHQPDRPGLMPQHEAEEFAQLDGAPARHRAISAI